MVAIKPRAVSRVTRIALSCCSKRARISAFSCSAFWRPRSDSSACERVCSFSTCSACCCCSAAALAVSASAFSRSAFCAARSASRLESQLLLVLPFAFGLGLLSPLCFCLGLGSGLCLSGGRRFLILRDALFFLTLQ